MENGMQFMTSLLGGSQNALLNMAFALGVVLVLIALTAWVLKFARRAGTGMVRGRHRRLTVVDTVQVDGRRQLLIIRRDNVEHLIMTGGPQDVVVESGIPAPDPVPNRRSSGPIEPATATPPMPAATPPGEHRLALRRTGLLRPDTRQRPEVIPMAPALRVDNSAGPTIDSGKPTAIHGGGSEARLDGGGQRSFGGDDRPIR
jgi:flagellar biogenesis protein FliO